VPTVRWPTLAPNGKHVLVARVQYVPYQIDQLDHLANGESVTAAIGRAVPGFEARVLHRSVLTPRDLETQFAVTNGALTHGELTLDQILFMRPVAGLGRHAMPIDGLYLGGSGAHPGPGVLGGAGWLAARAAVSPRAKRVGMS
jgi:phytoene dehydrogenase-like protein